MKRLLLALALGVASGLFSAPDGLASALEQARQNLAKTAGEKSHAEHAVLPLEKAVRNLKAEENPWWWTRWRLRTDLSVLQERLYRLREAGEAYERSRQRLFLILSAQEEELRSTLGGDLERSYVSRDQVQRLFEQKRGLDQELEALGFGEGKPFPLVAVPGEVDSPLLEEDRQKALQARAIQLEAWHDTVSEDLHLIRRAQQRGALDPEDARKKLAELGALSKRIEMMMRATGGQLVSKN